MRESYAALSLTATFDYVENVILGRNGYRTNQIRV